MGKPRCKQLRKITVGNVEYKWLVEKPPGDKQETFGIHLKIWDNKKKLIFDAEILRYDEIREVTPKIVKKIIIDVDWYHMGM